MFNSVRYFTSDFTDYPIINHKNAIISVSEVTEAVVHKKSSI